MSDTRQQLARIQQLNLVVLGAAIGWTGSRYGRFEAWSLGLGGALGTLNFWATSVVVRRTFAAPQAPSSGLVILKFLASFGAVGMAVLVLKPDGVGFGAGFCSILAAIVLSAILDLAAGQKDDDGQDAHVKDEHDRGV